MGWAPPPLVPAPDARLTHAFAGCLPGGRLAGPLLAFRSVASTQAVCRALAEAGAPEGTVALADHQTAGRGRRGRVWVAPSGAALLVSCLLRPPLLPARWPDLMLVAACAVAEGLDAVAGLAPRLRWPNDVLAEGRKLAGVLAEGVVGPVPFVVLGIGVNVAQGADDWPADLAGRAVALAELGHRVPREAVLAAILDRLAARYDELLREGLEPTREAWRRRGAFGARVEAHGVRGVALDLAPDGALLIRADDGETVAIGSGEVAARGLAAGGAE